METSKIVLLSIIVFLLIISAFMFYSNISSDTKHTESYNHLYGQFNENNNVHFGIMNGENHSENHSENQLIYEMNSENHSENHSDMKSEMNSENHSEINSENHGENHSEMNSENHSEMNSDNNSDNNSEMNSDNNSDTNSELIEDQKNNYELFEKKIEINNRKYISQEDVIKFDSDQMIKNLMIKKLKTDSDRIYHQNDFDSYRNMYFTEDRNMNFEIKPETYEKHIDVIYDQLMPSNIPEYQDRYLKNALYNQQIQNPDMNHQDYLKNLAELHTLKINIKDVADCDIDVIDKCADDKKYENLEDVVRKYKTNTNDSMTYRYVGSGILIK